METNLQIKNVVCHHYMMSVKEILFIRLFLDEG